MTRTEILHAIAEHEAAGEDHDELDGRLAYLDGAYFTWDAPSADFRGGETRSAWQRGWMDQHRETKAASAREAA